MAGSPRAKSRDPQVWRTRDGRLIRVDAMEDTHLLNTLAYLHRRASEYLADSRFEGKLSTISIDDMLVRGVPQYQTMLAEAVRRGLWDVVPGREDRRARRRAAPAPGPQSAVYARFAGLIFDE